MADSFVRVPADSVGKRVDATSLDVGADTVYRQRIVIGDNSATAQFATVTGGALVVTGTINVSAMPTVTVSLAAGSILDSISATVGVKGQVSIGPGTSNIGFINNISATVAVTGTVALVAGAANIGFINNISATVLVAGNVSLAAGTSNIGFINNISATVVVGGVISLTGTATMIVGGFLDPSGNQKNVVDSANTALRVNVVAGGTGGGAVFGQVSAGASLSVTNIPVLIGGNDSAGGAGGIARTLLLDTSGRIILGASTNNIGAVSNAAGTALMGAVSLAAGTAKIGFIGKISATVTVTGVVTLGAGAANIGTVNNISATVAVGGEIANGSSLSTTNKPVLMGGNDSAGGAGGVARTLLLDTSGRIILGAGANNIGAVSNAAGTALMGAVSLAAGTAKIGFIGKISASVTVQGNVNISTMPSVVLAAGAANIGTIQAISATVNAIVAGRVAISVSVTVGDQPVLMGGVRKDSASGTATAIFGWYDGHGRNVTVKNHVPLLPSASHGPKCVTVSTSATVALVGAPGAGLCVYVTQIACTNGSATLTRADAYAASQTASCVTQMYMAANGGGFVQNFDPPIKVLSNTALNSRVKPNVSQAIFVVHFYVGAK